MAEGSAASLQEWLAQEANAARGLDVISVAFTLL
jgi:hypothetical protein